MENEKLYKDCLKEWGIESQLFMVIEETSELQKAICKLMRGGSVANLMDEMADTEIMLEQLKIIISTREKKDLILIDAFIQNRKRIKLKRLKRLIKK